MRISPCSFPRSVMNSEWPLWRLYRDFLIYMVEVAVKFVSSREIRVNPKPVFDSLEEGEVVITSRGKPVALLLGVSGEDLEETVRLVRRVRAQAAVSRMRKSAARQGLHRRMDLDEIEQEVRAARSERS